MQQRHHSDTNQEGRTELWVLKSGIHRATANEQEQHRPLICVTVHG
ncbi:hypothetical protein [Streptomyces sp. SS1-1]|nr:hypothetical protein [Streptomyces sp. SS1-1]